MDWEELRLGVVQITLEATAQRGMRRKSVRSRFIRRILIVDYYDIKEENGNSSSIIGIIEYGTRHGRLWDSTMPTMGLDNAPSTAICSAFFEEAHRRVFILP